MLKLNGESFKINRTEDKQINDKINEESTNLDNYVYVSIYEQKQNENKGKKTIMQFRHKLRIQKTNCV